MNYYALYVKENIKSKIVGLVKGKLGRLGTSMECVINTLQSRQCLKKDAEALELFGMFGLWHTKDYIDYIGKVDFFDIDYGYIKYAEKVFGNKKGKITFHNEDSIAFIQNTNKLYDLVIADTPNNPYFFCDDIDLPFFLNDMIRVTKQGGVVIFNIHTNSLKKWDYLKDEMIKKSTRPVKDIFVLYRNDLVSYVVMIFDN